MKTEKDTVLRRGIKIATLDFHPDFKNSAENLLQVSEHRRRWAAIADLFRATVKRSERVETYDDAISRLKLSSEALALRRRELTIESRIFYGVAFAEMLLAMVFASGIFAALICAAAGVCFILQGAQRAIRVRQIDKKAFEHPREWLRDSEYWFV